MNTSVAHYMGFRPAMAWAVLAILASGACSPDGVDFRDRTGPHVVKTEPVDGMQDVPVNTPVRAIYSEALGTKSFFLGAFSMVDESGKPVEGALSLQNDTLTFQPTQLNYGTKYRISLGTTIRDLFGNRSKAFIWSFQTGADTDAPGAPYNLDYRALSNQFAVQVNGAKDAGSFLEVNGERAQVDLAATSFTLSLPLSNEGENAFSFAAVDDAGNRSDPAVISIERDTEAPAGLKHCPTAAACGCPLTALWWHSNTTEGCWNPPDPLYWKNESLPMGLEWAPQTDEYASIRIGSSASPAFTEARFSYDALLLDKPATAKTLSAVVNDLAGNVTVSFSRQLVIDSDGPTLGLQSASPAIFSPIGAPSATTTADAVSLTFVRELDSVFHASIDGQTVPPIAVSSTGMTFPISGLTEGSHLFAVAATDAAGNTTRVAKVIHVDQTAPLAVSVPRNNATTGGQPILHIFTNEPVTVAGLQFTRPGPVTQTLTGNAVINSNRRHWTFTPAVEPDILAPGVYSATVNLIDDAGNTNSFAWTFTATGSPNAAPTSGSPSFITGGSRNPLVSFTALQAAAVNVIRVRKNFLGNSYETVATYATAATFTVEPLSMLAGWIDTYNDDGTYVTAAIANPSLNDSVPFMGEDFSGRPDLVYASALRFDSPVKGFTLFDDTGYWYRVYTSGSAEQSIFQACNSGGAFPTYPMIALDEPFALLGMYCPSADPVVTPINLVTHTADLPNRWSANGEANFGAVLASGRFYGSSINQVVVGSPSLNDPSRVYIYASSAATAAALLLEKPTAAAIEFGASVAIADAHKAGASTLAVVATGYQQKAPVVYFFGNDVTTSLIPTYQAVATLPVPKYLGSVVSLRYEIMAPGDLDGDGSTDFVAAAWSDIPLNGFQFDAWVSIFLGGNEAHDGSPLRLNVPHYRTSAGARPRLMALGDLNADGYDDFGFIDTFGGGLIRVFYGNASGVPEQRLLMPFQLTATAHWALAGMLDVQGDGYPEFILGRYDSPLLTLMAWP